jgi:hypothetical protein
MQTRGKGLLINAGRISLTKSRSNPLLTNWQGDMDGPDGHNPALNNQSMSAAKGRIKVDEGRGAIIILELRARASLPLAAAHKNLRNFKTDDHHGRLGLGFRNQEIW